LWVRPRGSNRTREVAGEAPPARDIAPCLARDETTRRRRSRVKEKTEAGTCVHPPCDCKIPPGHLYCSDACDGARDEQGCACGHEGCAAAGTKRKSTAA